MVRDDSPPHPHPRQQMEGEGSKTHVPFIQRKTPKVAHITFTSSWLKSSRMTTCSCKEAEQLYISSEFSCVPLTHQSLWKKREIQNWVTSSSFCNILIFLQKVNPWIIHLQFGPIFTFSENKSFIIGKHYYTLHWKYLMLCAVLEKGMKALMPLCKL